MSTPEQLQSEIRNALEPVLHWYQSDEHDPRSVASIIEDVVADLVLDRDQILSVQRVAQYAKRQCEEGCPVSAFNLSEEILRIIKGCAATPEQARIADLEAEVERLADAAETMRQALHGLLQSLMAAAAEVERPLQELQERYPAQQEKG